MPIPTGVKGDLAAVRTEHRIAVTMRGRQCGLIGAICIHDVDVMDLFIDGMAAYKRDSRAVRAEDRIVILAFSCREPLQIAAIGIHRIDVAAMVAGGGKGDLAAVRAEASAERA